MGFSYSVAWSFILVTHDLFELCYVFVLMILFFFSVALYTNLPLGFLITEKMNGDIEGKSKSHPFLATTTAGSPHSHLNLSVS